MVKVTYSNRVTATALTLALTGCGAAADLGRTPTTSASGPTSGPVGSGPSGSGMLAVPDLAGKTIEEAQAIARAAGFSQEVEERPMHCDDSLPKVDAHIRCQDPEPGKMVQRYQMIGVATYSGFKHAGVLMRDQLHPLVGMTVADAKQRLKELGHTGPVTVIHENEYQSQCGRGKVCSMENDNGISLNDELIFYINPER